LNNLSVPDSRLNNEAFNKQHKYINTKENPLNVNETPENVEKKSANIAEIEVIFKKIQVNDPSIIENLISHGVPHDIAIEIIKRALHVAVLHYSK
jgi:hypothetical protein